MLDINWVVLVNVFIRYLRKFVEVMKLFFWVVSFSFLIIKGRIGVYMNWLIFMVVVKVYNLLVVKLIEC